MQLCRDEALAKLQATILEILDAIASFCAEHEITWFLDSGTTLGALRHGGFIPWDDDADVGMLRADWERFTRLARDRFIPGFSVHTAKDTEGFDGIMAKVYRDGTRFIDRRAENEGFEQGIFVDVFPYDALFADERRARAQLRRARFWTYVLYLAGSGDVNVPHGGALGATERLGAALANPLVHALFSKERALGNFERAIPRPGDAVSDIVVPLPYELRHPIETLVPPATHEFCGRQFPVPADAEDYLRVKYGDWRRLPPPEARKSHLPVLIDFGDGDVYGKDEAQATS